MTGVTTMAGRIRSIKPELPQDEALASCSRDARHTYVLLWTIADDAGRFRAAPAYMRSALYPYDEDVTSADVEAWTYELVRIGKVRTYCHNGQRYGDIPTWRTHQRIDRPQPSHLPAFDECSPVEPEPPAEDSTSARRMVVEPSSKARRGLDDHSATERKGPGGDLDQESPHGDSPVSPRQQVWAAWLAATGRTRCKLDAHRKRVIERALRDYPLEDVVDAVRGWVHDPWPDRRRWNDVEHLLRDAATIERFRDLARHGPPLPPEFAETAQTLDEWAAAHERREREVVAVLDEWEEPA